jgi:methylase of polypeptide subunit release factors
VVLGKEFLVLPTVFSPRYYHETAFFTEHVVGLLSTDEAYLDLGCGVGVTAVFAALHGARVHRTRCQPGCGGECDAERPADQVSERVTVAQSDVYSALSPGQQFDTIYWNVPFVYRADGTSLTALEEAIYDPGYRKNREFIGAAHQHLKRGGQLLMGVSSTLGDVDAVDAV